MKPIKRTCRYYTSKMCGLVFVYTKLYLYKNRINHLKITGMCLILLLERATDLFRFLPPFSFPRPHSDPNTWVIISGNPLSTVFFSFWIFQLCFCLNHELFQSTFDSSLTVEKRGQMQANPCSTTPRSGPYIAVSAQQALLKMPSEWTALYLLPFRTNKPPKFWVFMP